MSEHAAASNADPAGRKAKLLVLETHPIQYRAPIFQAYEQAFPGELEVVYASDFSVRGYSDAGFGATFAWDTPLLSGYNFRVLDNLRDSRLVRASSLSARGVARLVAKVRPDAVLMHSLHYHYNWVAYLAALLLRTPVWIRVETQDEAVERGRIKGWVRAAAYRLLYAGVSRAFYIGELNQQHLLRHGLRPHQLTAARYCTPDPIAALSLEEKPRLRVSTQESLGIEPGSVVISFFGKFIPKKDPQLILQSLLDREQPIAAKVVCLFVGSGELEAPLKAMAAALEAKHGVKTVFAGFVNQSKLAGYYLASDIVVLPSRRQGETWGLVVNEALRASCGVVVSEADGSHKDLAGWEGVRVIAVGAAKTLGAGPQALFTMPRDIDWARESLTHCAEHATAVALNATLLQPVAA